MGGFEDLEWFWQGTISSDEALVDVVPDSESWFLAFKRAQVWTSRYGIKEDPVYKSWVKLPKKDISVREENKVDIDRESNWEQTTQNWQTKNILFLGWGKGVVNEICKYMNIAEKLIQTFVQPDAQQQMRS